MNPEDIHAVAQAMEKKTVQKKENIIVQGQEGDYFYIVESGTVQIIVNGSVVTTMNRGTHFGELALLYNSPRTATVQSSSEETRLFCLTRDAFIFILSREAETRYREIQSTLRKVSILSGLTSEQLERLAEAVEVAQHPAGFEIIKKGNDGNVFYMIKHGSVRVSDLGDQFADHTLSEGEYFGEKALLTGEPRKATVTAQTDVTLLALDRPSFTEFLGPIASMIDENNNVLILKSIKVFESLSPEELTSLAKSLKLKTFAAGSMIIREGDEGDKFYLLKSGTADVVKGTTLVVSLSPGQYFGEMALINEDKRTASIVSTSDCECFELNRATFQNILSCFDTEEGRKRKMELETIQVSNYDFSQLKSIGLLGTGTFGRVTLVKDEESGSVFALKAMIKSQVKAMGQTRNIQNEKNMMTLASGSPFILRLHQTFQDPLRLYMLLEFVQGGELFSILYSGKPGVTNEEARFYGAGVLEALAFIHNKSIAYRDMKPENLLIDRVGYPKLVDFGFAKIITNKSYTFCGTPDYLAPEIVLNRGHNKSVDYWSFGVLLYEMQTGSTPFTAPNQDQARTFKNITTCSPRFSARFNVDCKDLILNLLSPDPRHRLGNKRGGINDIRTHPWFKPLDFEAYRNKTIRAPWIPHLRGESDTSNFNTEGLENDHLEADPSSSVDDIDWGF